MPGDALPVNVEPENSTNSLAEYIAALNAQQHDSFCISHFLSAQVIGFWGPVRRMPLRF